jgi:hypothetical protein
MPRFSLSTTLTALTILLLAALGASAQDPLAPRRGAGSTITPAYEGWYPNPDGTINLSFGYYSRNTEEIVDIPIGPENFFSPGPEDQGQPDEFHPLRHWGVFTVTVPADFGESKLTWTLINRGKTFAIPAHLHPDWLIDAEKDPASGNMPPRLKFAAKGPEGGGPDGITAEPRTVAVGEPLELTVWATDDEVPRGSFRRQRDPIMLTWAKHTGPGKVSFSETEPKVDKAADGKASTTATFDTPGEYVLRLRANDFSGVSSAGHSQCCWSNGYVQVSVKE